MFNPYFKCYGTIGRIPSNLYAIAFKRIWMKLEDKWSFSIVLYGYITFFTQDSSR